MENQQPQIKNHLTLAVVSLVLSCLSPVAMPAGIASLIFALRADDKIKTDIEAAKQSSKLAAVFGWISVALVVIPWVLVIVFWAFLGAGLLWMLRMGGGF